MPQHELTGKSDYIRKTNSEIRKIASDLRRALDIHKQHAPDLVAVLRRYKEINPKFRLKKVSDTRLPRADAKANCGAGVLEVRTGILLAVDKYGAVRPRWTIAHELGHLVLGHPGWQFRKHPDEPVSLAQQILESEADTFASEFLAPAYLAAKCKSKEEIARLFQISSEAAARRKAELDKERDAENRKRDFGPAESDSTPKPRPPLNRTATSFPRVARSLRAFVAMSFSDDATRLYREILKPAIESAGLICQRADEISSADAIADDIRRAINESDLIVAEISGLNPNVMHEIGLAQSLEKPTILVCRNDYKENEIPSNIRHIRRITYPNDAGGGPVLGRQLQQTLQAIASAINGAKESGPAA